MRERDNEKSGQWRDEDKHLKQREKGKKTEKTHNQERPRTQKTGKEARERK